MTINKKLNNISEYKEVQNKEKQEKVINEDGTEILTEEFLKTTLIPNNTKINTKEVTTKTVRGYYTSIANNLQVAGQSMYYVCRELYNAKVNLITVVKGVNGKVIEKREAYEELLGLLNLSRTVAEKYLSIGKSPRLRMLEKSGRLPDAWTTQYHLSSMSDDHYKQVEKNITSTRSIAKINKDIEKPETSGSVNVKTKTFNLLDIDIYKDSIDSTILKNIKGRLLLLLQDDEELGSIIRLKFNPELEEALIERELKAQKVIDDAAEKKAKEKAKKDAKKKRTLYIVEQDLENAKADYLTLGKENIKRPDVVKVTPPGQLPQ